jgi:MFS family permease
MFQQPKAVWAVAFACVVAFMGIGLVDPMLPALAQSLHADASQVELLFTSYFAITGAAMLVTGFVSGSPRPFTTSASSRCSPTRRSRSTSACTSSATSSSAGG